MTLIDALKVSSVTYRLEGDCSGGAAWKYYSDFRVIAFSTSGSIYRWLHPSEPIKTHELVGGYWHENRQFRVIELDEQQALTVSNANDWEPV